MRGDHLVTGSSLTIWNWRNGVHNAITVIQQYPMIDGVGFLILLLLPLT
jgi:hypothetical protein